MDTNTILGDARSTGIAAVTSRRRFLRASVGTIGGIAFGIPTLSSCAKGNEAGAARQNKDVLTLALAAPPQTLNPALAGNGDPIAVVFELSYDSLIYARPDGSLTPGLATSWGYVGTDNQVFEIGLRDGVKFSDGTDLTADGVKEWLLYYQAAGGPNAKRLDIQSIDTSGPLGLRIKLGRPDPLVPYYLTPRSVTGDAVSPRALQDPGKLGTSTYGAGPYMLDPTQTITNRTYTFVPNPYYWNKQAVHWKKVVVEVMVDTNASLLAMRSGKIDYMLGSPQTADSARAAGFNVITQPTWIAEIQFLDRSGAVVPALGDLRVRQALNHAVNRTEITKALYGQYGRPLGQMTIPGADGYSDELAEYYTYDPAKAKQLLADAGYPTGFTLPMVAFNVNPGMTTAAQAIASYWEKIGVKAEISVPPDTSQYVKTITGGRPATQIFYPSADPIYAILGYTLMTPSKAAFYNPYHAADATLDDLYRRASVANDTQRPEIERDINKRWLELAWFVPFAAVEKIAYVQPGLEGVSMSARLQDPNPVSFYAS